MIPLLALACSAPWDGSTRFVDPTGDRPAGEDFAVEAQREDLLALRRTADWNLENASWGEPEDGHPSWTSADVDPWLSTDVDLDAESVTGFRWTVLPREGWNGQSVRAQLFWSHETEGPFSESRQVAADGLPVGDRGVLAYDFLVSGHPEWAGRIRRIRLDPGSFPASGARVVHLRFAALTFSPPSSDAVVRARIGGDARPSWVLEPGGRRTVEARVPTGGVLRFAYGRTRIYPLLAPDPALRELRVTVGPIPSDAAAGPIPPRLAAAVVLPGDSGRWREMEIPLDDLVGRRIRLDFTAEGPSSSRHFANPVLVSGVAVEPRARSDARLNVVWIVADTLRADRTSLYGHRRVTTPRLDAWARERGAVVRSATPAATWTLPSHVSMFSGLAAPTHGVRFPTDRLGGDLPYLPEVLWRAGYSTTAITGGGFVDPGHGFARGFDRFDVWRGGTGAAEEIRDRTRAALSAIDRPHHRPFFLFFHTYEPHSPFRARQPYFSELAPGLHVDPGFEVRARGEKDPVRRDEGAHLAAVGSAENFGLDPEDLLLLDGLYDSGVAEMDHWLGELLQLLESRDLAENTLVVFTSDHGESLGEGGLFGHGNLEEPTLAVPLVFGLPRSLGRPATIETPFRSIDLVPTVLDLLGLDPLPGLDGTSLATALRGRETPAPGPALITTAWTNRGIALRSSELGLSAVLGDSIWPEGCGTRRYFRREGVHWVAVDESPRSLRWLRDSGLLDRRDEAGLWIRLRARTEPVHLRLSGPPSAPPSSSVKWRGGACPLPSLHGDELRLEIPPGSESLLLWIGAAPGISLILASSGAVVDPLEPEDPERTNVALFLRDGVWTTGRLPADADADASFEWRWPAGGLARSHRDAEAVEATLRGLGYL